MIVFKKKKSSFAIVFMTPLLLIKEAAANFDLVGQHVDIGRD